MPHYSNFYLFIYFYLDFPRKEKYDRKWKTIMIVNKGKSCIKMNNKSKGPFGWRNRKVGE